MTPLVRDSCEISYKSQLYLVLARLIYIDGDVALNCESISNPPW